MVRQRNMADHIKYRKFLLFNREYTFGAKKRLKIKNRVEFSRQNEKVPEGTL